MHRMAEIKIEYTVANQKTEEGWSGFLPLHMRRRVIKTGGVKLFNSCFRQNNMESYGMSDIVLTQSFNL